MLGNDENNVKKWLGKVSNHYEKTGRMNRVLIQIRGVRRAERDFIISRDAAFVAPINDQIAQFVHDADALKRTVSDKAQVQIAERLAREAKTYQAAFQRYASIFYDIQEIDRNMQEAAYRAMNKIQVIRQNQEDRLTPAILSEKEDTRKQAEALSDHQLEMIRKAEHLVRWFLMIQNDETKYRLNNDKAVAGRIDQLLDRVLALAQEMGESIESLSADMLGSQKTRVLNQRNRASAWMITTLGGHHPDRYPPDGVYSQPNRQHRADVQPDRTYPGFACRVDRNCLKIALDEKGTILYKAVDGRQRKRLWPPCA